MRSRRPWKRRGESGSSQRPSAQKRWAKSRLRDPTAQVASSAEFTNLTKEVQKMGQAYAAEHCLRKLNIVRDAQEVQGLEVTVTERVMSEVQHVQDIFAILVPRRRRLLC